MKTGIHPNYFVAKVTCACGNTFNTRSTIKEIRLEICSACHPFFTGKQRLVDTAGRVERFQKRFAKTSGQTVRRKPKTRVKKVEVVGASVQKKQKVLSTSPMKQESKEKKPAKKKPAKED
ncbi:MAG: 50S ribosomal protein L31 [Elusimicrobiota bacterium]